MDIWGAASLVRCRRSVLTEVLGEIDCGFLDSQQRLGRRSFRVNHIVAFELDMEKLKLVALGRVAGDGRAIDQHLRWNQRAIDQNAMERRHVEIGMRDIGSESRAGDANRLSLFRPWLRPIAFLERITADPLDGAQSAEYCRQQIADREIFDFPVATYGSDRRTLQEAVGRVS
jgi:hypothetical protein